MSYVYILKCNDNTYYTGWTKDLSHRLKMHNLGRGAKYTRARLPVALVYWEELSSQSLAMRREIAIKKMSRKEKEQLIRDFQKPD